MDMIAQALGVLLILSVVTLLFSVAGIIYRFPPFRNRNNAGWAFIASLIAVVVSGALINFLPSDGPEQEWLTAASEPAAKAAETAPRQVQDFTEKEFYWDEKTRPYKDIIIAGVNKIHRENPRCKDMEPLTAYVADDSTPENPRFLVQCGEDLKAFNQFFTKSEVESGRCLRRPVIWTRQRAPNCARPTRRRWPRTRARWSSRSSWILQ